MIYSIYPVKDSTIYENTSSMNTGIDQILEINKSVNDGDVYNSQVLIQFDISEISESIVDGTITGSTNYYLNLYSTEHDEIPRDYTLYAYAISGSWDSGIGKHFHEPNTTDGVSWLYRNGTDKWATSSYSPNVTSSYQTNEGGATYYTSSVASQSFSVIQTDVRMDITDIVNSWLDNSIENNGLVVKLSDEDTTNIEEQGNKKYFSLDTHTIYVPKLEVAWDNSSFVTGSLTELTTEDKVLYVKQLHQKYKTESKTRIRVAGRERYKPRNFCTSSAYTDTSYLPETTYYSVQDSVTKEIVIPFDDTHTKVSCDAEGNYFDLWMSGFAVERFYKILFKVEQNGTTEIYDNDFLFKVVR